MILSKGKKRRLGVVGVVSILLFTCWLGMFLVKQWAMQPVYPGAVPYGEVKQDCTELVFCHSQVNFYTYDAPETVSEYFRDKGLHLVSSGASGGRPTFLYETSLSGSAKFGPLGIIITSQIFINYGYREHDGTTIYQTSDIYVGWNS
jgi:hypothetical protein